MIQNTAAELPVSCTRYINGATPSSAAAAHEVSNTPSAQPRRS